MGKWLAVPAALIALAGCDRTQANAIASAVVPIVVDLVVDQIIDDDVHGGGGKF